MVSLALLVTRKVSPIKAFLYVTAQGGGAIAGAALLYGQVSFVNCNRNRIMCTAHVFHTRTQIHNKPGRKWMVDRQVLDPPHPHLFAVLFSVWPTKQEIATTASALLMMIIFFSFVEIFSLFHHRRKSLIGVPNIYFQLIRNSVQEKRV